MPTMPRMKGKATKIAYKVIGKPLNLQEKLTPQERAIQERLEFEATVRVR